VVSSVSFVETESSRSVPETVYVAEALPEGYTMAFEESGQQYVTIIQDHHTFAIPLAGRILHLLHTFSKIKH